MSKADMMLHDLGFRPKYLNPMSFHHKDNEDFEVSFFPHSKSYEVYVYNNNPIPEKDFHLDANNYNVIMTVELHMAIHEKMKELGWIE